MIKIGEIITLDNGSMFAVVSKVAFHGKDYYLLLTMEKPVKIKACTVEENDQITLFEDKRLIKEILLKLL